MTYAKLNVGNVCLNLGVYCNICLPFSPTLLAPALEPTEAYPTHSYASQPHPSLAPTPVPNTVQEDHGSLHNNGEIVAHEQHSLVNMITATTSDTITLHTGKGL